MNGTRPKLNRTYAEFIRGGLTVSRWFAGKLTASQIQTKILSEKLGCQRVTKVQYHE